jgi:hypothetical protein
MFVSFAELHTDSAICFVCYCALVFLAKQLIGDLLPLLRLYGFIFMKTRASLNELTASFTITLITKNLQNYRDTIHTPSCCMLGIAGTKDTVPIYCNCIKSRERIRETFLYSRLHWYGGVTVLLPGWIIWK